MSERDPGSISTVADDPDSRLSRQAGRNFRLGVYNGVLVNGAEAFFHSTLVLAPFLAALGAPTVLIGLIPALRIGGWFLPQLLVASRLAHQPFKLPWYRRVSLLRITAFSLMTASVFVFRDSPNLLAGIVMAMIAVNAIGGGVSGVPFADVTAKVVPHFRLGTFWALRNAIGGALALLSGMVLRRILASPTPFPVNFGYLFVIGTVLSGVAYLSYSLIREPAGKPAQKQPLRKMIGRIPGVLRRDESFRRYLRVRILALLALLAEPFYAIYALRELNAPASVLGAFVIVSTFASITGNLLFRRPANGGRNVNVLQISVALLALAPLWAMLAPTWQAFGLVFALSAAGNTGMGIAAWNLLYAVSTEAERPLYIGTANSFLSLPSLAPIVAGAVLGLVGYGPLFGLAALCALTALAFAFRFTRLADLDRRALKVIAEGELEGAAD